MNKRLSIFLIASMSLWAAQAQAQNAASATPKATKVAKATTSKKAVSTKEPAAIEDNEKEPDTGASAASELQCELGNKVTLYHNAEDDQNIALRWHKRVHRMARVGTSTGAHRYENQKIGLVWIGIPGKGMLLDSKKGHQLANECKTVEQMMPKKPVIVETEKLPEEVKPVTLDAPKAPEEIKS